MSTSTFKKPERKIIEKNRRNHMKDLYTSLFSLVPDPRIVSKEGDQADRVERTIEYIETLKANLEMIKNKKNKLLSKKRSTEHTKIINSECISLNVQIHDMTHDHDIVLVTGLKTHSSFCDVVQFLDQYCTEVTYANFSSSGHSVFHILQKKIGADDLSKRLKNLIENKNELGDFDASFCNEVGLDLSVRDFDVSLCDEVLGLDLSVRDFDASFCNEVGLDLSVRDFDASLCNEVLDLDLSVRGFDASLCNEVGLDLSVWDFDASFCNEVDHLDLSLWNFDVLEMLPVNDIN